MFRYLPKRISHSRVKHCCARLFVSGHRTKSTLGTEDNYATKSGLRENMIEMKSLFNEMNQKMNETALGLAGLTVTMGTLMIGLMIALHDVSTNNLQRQAEGFSKRIEAQDARFESQNVRFESQNDKLESQDRKIDAQDSKIEAQDMIIKSKSK